MRDIPIIFSGPMVRALLEGRKTMTRRELYRLREAKKVDGVPVIPGHATFLEAYRPGVADFGHYWALSPWHRVQPGDRLWVRENLIPGSCGLDYAAGGDESLDLSDLTEDQVEFWNKRAGDDPDQSKTVPCIHMPRWASRLTLIVSAVKIERLQDIGEADAIAEGIACVHCRGRGYVLPTFGANHFIGCEVCDKIAVSQGLHLLPGQHATPINRNIFRDLWKTLHGPDAWNANPFVVAITFRVIKANIDAPEARVAA
jgi:hypothetical protein